MEIAGSVESLEAQFKYDPNCGKRREDQKGDGLTQTKTEADKSKGKNKPISQATLLSYLICVGKIIINKRRHESGST